MMQAVGDYFRELCERFGVGWNRFWYAPSDPSVLSLIRILAGSMALFLHVTMGFDLIRFFGPNGWLPADVVQRLGIVMNLEGEVPGFSYLFYVSSPAALWTLHAVGFVILVLFTLGLFSRITSILAAIVILSDVNRAPMLTSQMEPVLTFVLLYLCCGPTGAYFSIDRLLAARKRSKVNKAQGLVPRSTGATIAIRLMQVHLALIYAIMGLSKLWGGIWWSGTGVWYLLVRPQSPLMDLTGLQAYPYLIDIWTHAVIAFELSFAILIWNRLARPLLLGISVVMWTLHAVISGQVLFSLMMLIAGLAFVSPTLLKARLADRQKQQVAESRLTATAAR